MSEKEKKKKTTGISRREFLRDAGILAGGAAIGSTILLAACKGGETTKTVTTTIAGTTQTVTTTQQVGTATVTTTLPGQTVTTTVTGLAEAVEGLITLNVNGEDHILKVESDWTLAFVLRNQLGLTATKEGCNMGECGTCTVIIDGEAIYSCLTLAIEAEGKSIQTLEGISDGITLHPVQQAFFDHQAMQCGYCTPGFIMATKALLDKNPNPTRDEVKEALSGHLCICGHYKKIVEAVLAV
jgi:carbon-monoxide dehydrogenase small subunit